MDCVALQKGAFVPHQVYLFMQHVLAAIHYFLWRILDLFNLLIMGFVFRLVFFFHQSNWLKERLILVYSMSAFLWPTFSSHPV